MPRPRSEAARAAMVQAARELLVTEGVDACTVDEVARRTGIAKTTIYRHVGSTDGLVLAAVDGMVKEAPPPDTGSLRGDLHVIVRRYLRIADDPHMRALFAWMMRRSTQDPAFAEAFRRVRIQPTGSTVVALQRAIARGEVAPTLDVSLAMHLVQGPLMSKRIVANERLTEDEVDALLDLVVIALASTTGR